MKKSDLNKLKKLLDTEKQRLLNQNSSKVVQDDIKHSTDDLADEVDLASSELNQSMTMRLRDRDRTLLFKIEKALSRIEEGTFGICESCEEPIEIKRLMARPIATLCISCKEEQEQEKKMKRLTS